MSDFERLRRLLLGDADARLDAHAQRLDAAEQAHASLAQELPELLQENQRQDGTARLSAALALPVASALGTAVREQRQTIVDALFPIIGPAIRKAIAESLRDFTEGFNRALESSLSPRGLRWRLEAWRSGVSYADVVLRHSLSFRIDHLFLIQRDSGLLLQHQSAADLAQPDGDAIAGMLTAIGDFVRDSVAGDMGERSKAALATASVGEHLLWLVEGPRANLAVFLRGVPPAALRSLLAERLERWHAQHDAESGAASQDSEADSVAWNLAELQRSAGNAGAQQVTQPRRWPLLLLAALLMLGLALWGWRGWVWQQRLAGVESRLNEWPGLHLDRIESPRVGEVHIRGLLDPLADSPEAAIRDALPPDSRVQVDFRGYVSTDAELLLRRARQMLVPPDTVGLSLQGNRLVMRGVASAAWIAQATDRASVPGITETDRSGLVAAVAPPSSARLELSALIPRLETARIEFLHDVEPVDIGAIEPMARDALRAVELSNGLGLRLSLECHGYVDATGTPTANRHLRQARAEWLCAELVRRGISADVLRAASGEEAAQSAPLVGRVASLRAATFDGAAVHD